MLRELHIKNVAVIEGKGVGEKPPDLSLQNSSPVKDQQAVEDI